MGKISISYQIFVFSYHALTLLWTLLLLSLKMNVPRIKLLKVGCPQDKISESRMSPKTGKHKKRATPLFRPNLRYEIEK